MRKYGSSLLTGIDAVLKRGTSKYWVHDDITIDWMTEGLEQRSLV